MIQDYIIFYCFFATLYCNILYGTIVDYIILLPTFWVTCLAPDSRAGDGSWV